MASTTLVLSLFLFSAFYVASCKRYEPNWDSLDSRPLPQWYDGAKVGIFLHWGVFSVPSFGSEWFWNFWQIQHRQPFIDFMNKNFKPNFTYQDFAKSFTTEFYNPDQWADIFNASGARYVVLTSKHHEGYTLWPSKYSWNWNAMDVGPRRDLVGELAIAVRKHPNIRFGLYHSLFEWFNPLWQQDKAMAFKTEDFVKTKTLPELYELVHLYKPEIIWSDGEEEAPDTYWKSTKFLAWLYNDSPVKDTVVSNDRWGTGTACHHGDFYTCQDRYNPGSLQNHKWENAMTLDKSSWGYRREATLTDVLTIQELIEQLAGTVSCGGNLLVNVGPTKFGTIVPIFEERLRQMGQWLRVNGEAIYDSTPWKFQNDTMTPRIWYTSRLPNVYAILLDWPMNNQVLLGALHIPTFATVQIQMLGVDGYLPYRQDATGGTIVAVPPLTPDILPCQWAWVFKITGL